MKNANVQIYFGDGKGKTTAALGQSVREAGRGREVIFVQFLKGKSSDVIDFVKRLEPEMKLFRFEKSDRCYAELTAAEQAEQESNIRNGLNFVKKVIDTRGCDVLVLDEILGLLDNGLLTVNGIRDLVELADGEIDIILTGRCLPPEVRDLAGYIYQINTVKEMPDPKL